MLFTRIQEDIIQYIINYGKDPLNKLIPCIETFQHVFRGRYSKQEIEDNVDELISRGILTPYSFHSYIELTETFKSSQYYELIKNKKK